MEDTDSDSGGSWTTTFADLMSLLLTFFVLLLSFAQMDVIKFRDALGSLKNAFGYVIEQQGRFEARSTTLVEYEHVKKDSLLKDPVKTYIKQGRNEHAIVTRPVFVQTPKTRANEAARGRNKEILKRIREAIEKHNLSEMVEIEDTGREVFVRVKGQLLFNPGSASLKKDAYPLLGSIISIMEEFPYNMRIEGHTDDTPIKSASFPSNWELSTARAISALRYIMASGRITPGRIGAAGYADTRPVASNDDEKGRQRNRRVEFVFYMNKDV